MPEEAWLVVPTLGLTVVAQVRRQALHSAKPMARRVGVAYSAAMRERLPASVTWAALRVGVAASVAIDPPDAGCGAVNRCRCLQALPPALTRTCHGTRTGPLAGTVRSSFR